MKQDYEQSAVLPKIKESKLFYWEKKRVNRKKNNRTQFNCDPKFTFNLQWKYNIFKSTLNIF